MEMKGLNNDILRENSIDMRRLFRHTYPIEDRRGVMRHVN
jgi:hypothetical protein